MKILITYAIFAIGLSLASAQIPAPQIALTGNIGCQGFPCVNNGTLIFTSDANHTMTARETSAFYIKVTSSVSLTATRNLIAPLGNFPFTIENATTGGQSIQIIGASGTGVTIANGSTVSVWNDGTNFVQSGLSGSYLPLGGGTLTGALNGTSASFSGNVSAPTAVFGIANGIYNASQFGVKCDGATDDSAELNSIGTFAAAQTATGKTLTVSFPSNATCIHASSITTWLVPSLHIIGNGSRLKFTGSGNQLYLHSAASETDNTSITGFVLQGNAASTWGVYADSALVRGNLQILNIQDQNTGCGYFGATQVMNQFDFTCSSIKAAHMGIAQTVTPVTGILLGGNSDGTPSAGMVFAGNRYVNLTIEGVSGVGIHGIQACCSNIISGTSEDNGIGIQTEASWKNVDFFMDTEANSTSDVVEKGISNTYHNQTSTGYFSIAENAYGTEFGGSFNAITIGSTASNIYGHEFFYGAGTPGTITISGTPIYTLLTGIQQGTGTPYFYSTRQVQGISELISGGPKRFNTTNTSQSAARNFCESLDGSGYGLFELWGSASNSADACYNGTPMIQAAPANYLKFMGNVTVTPAQTQFSLPVVIGSAGSPIHGEFYGSGVLTFTSITAPGCQEQLLSISGAASGDVCFSSPIADIGAGYSYGGCRVSAANTVKIKVCATATGTPTAVTWIGWDRQ